MADNTILNTGAGGDTIATDDILGIKYPRSKIVIGADGVNGGDVSSANPMPVTAASLPLPTGAATEATLSTISGHITRCDTDTVQIAAILAGDNNIGNVDIVSLPTLPAGTNNIGDVDVLTLPSIPAGNNNIGDVDVVSCIPGTGPTNLGKAEDDPHVSADTGVMVLSVRDDTVTGVTSANGDYQCLKSDSAGRLYTTAAQAGTWNITNVSGTVSLPTGASTESTLSTLNGKVTACNTGAVTVSTFTPGSSASSLGKLEDAAHASGDTGVLLLGVRRDTATTMVDTDGDYHALIVDGNGRQHVNVGVSALPTGASTSAKQPALGTAGTAATDVITVQGIASMTALKVDGSAVAQPITDNSGSITVDGTITASNCAGDIASDGVDSGNPVKVGGQARTSDITAVANADRVNFIADVQGKQVTLPFSISENYVSGFTAAVVNTTDTAIIAAQGAGQRIYVTSIAVFNSHATVSTVVEIKDGSTVVFRGYALAAGGGFTVSFPTPIKLTANTALNGAAVTTGSNVYFNATGFKAP
jgi:hypothetical protein